MAESAGLKRNDRKSFLPLCNREHREINPPTAPGDKTVAVGDDKTHKSHTMAHPPVSDAHANVQFFSISRNIFNKRGKKDMNKIADCGAARAEQK